MKVALWMSITVFLLLWAVIQDPISAAAVASVVFGITWGLITFFQSLKARGRI